MTLQPDHRLERNAQRVRRAAALVPLSVISVSWTLAVAGSGLSPVPAAGGASASPGTPVEVSDLAVDAPASTSSFASGAVERPVNLVTVTQPGSLIPPSALAAYQRAATIIGGADEACGLDWPLLAAIGKVESGHGTTGGNRLSSEGVAVPGVVGIALDGSRGIAAISDTDGGRLDGDESWDRAVGPMQFIPSTWAVVGVDADDDGERNPQDVDDAALAAAVHLCSGSEDLSTVAGQRAALLRYNRSARYADLVLETARSYMASDALPAAAGVVVSPVSSQLVAPTRRGEGRRGGTAAPAVNRGDQGTADGVSPVEEPRGPRPDGPGGSAGNGNGGAKDGPAAPPAQPAPPARPTGPVDAVAGLLTRTEAILACTLAGLSELLQPSRFDDCVADRTS